MDAGFMLLVLSLALAAAGVLVSLRTLVGQREQAESVSERRRRAREDSMMRERLKAYPSDDDFSVRVPALLEMPLLMNDPQLWGSCRWRKRAFRSI